MLLMKANKGSFTEATRDSHTKYISLPTLALLAENTILVMEKVVVDTSESSLYSIMRAPPLPPELVSSLTEQLEKAVSLTENVLAGADEANEMHPPLVAVFGEGEGEGRGGSRGEDTAGRGGCGGDVSDVGGIEGEGICEGGEVEDALAVEGETGDCCVVEGEGASSEEEEGCFDWCGGCSGDGCCVEVEGRGVTGEVEEDGGDLV
ncbi:uncharacterized protein MONOS_16046 [Monocercomonoides exilis]|uniref:uncharacterized protein n=1 Tax=Monocercomonoides exilis TaxID=2049356 RepID=UPI00355995D6|nr:hypothetical protein MONOS_16046 [Monocercomonoides exilis]|eukprot:MONOS_16046.1-p1 / transcript=MONOS_16046.1 / gene=MONOS_16046 / organism=Monocercomonoides_exilis_PA203 / gene_product=unspecified product / transcript_product=unspecified product / location=Mono_scaffold01474:813-1471(+) / protein_length=206 / sequence_SO=supercontig / SO=protein_coding / is_pseudo=false